MGIERVGRGTPSRVAAVAAVVALVPMAVFVGWRRSHNDEVVARERAGLATKRAAVEIVQAAVAATLPSGERARRPTRPVAPVEVSASHTVSTKAAPESPLRAPTPQAPDELRSEDPPTRRKEGPSSRPPFESRDPSDVGPEAVVVLSPLLNNFEFGSTIGFLLLCQTAAGSGAAVAAEAELSAALGPAFSQITPACQTISDHAVNGIAGLREAIAPLAFLNPHSEEFFDQALTVAMLLDELSAELGPLGPTADGLGPIIEFYGPEDS